MPSSFFDAVDDLPNISCLPDMAKLLSASSYPHTTPSAPARRDSQKLMYGGILAAHDSAEEDEEEDEDDSRPTKKARQAKTNSSKLNENSQDAPKRQRGRPKVSTKDETAAERRRTQIRLAQRAYRNRKENTITELTQKVDSLQATMKGLNVGFARLRENLMNTGLVHTNSTIARQIDDLIRQLNDALESSPSDAEKTSDGDDSEPQGHGLPLDREDQYTMFDEHLAPMVLQGQTNPSSTVPATSLHSSLLGVGADHTMLDLEGQNLTDFQTFPALPTIYPTSFGSKTTTAPSHDPQPSSNSLLALTSVDRFPNRYTYTYSFQETTFARRLHRLCIERSYQRLMSPYVDPDWLLKKFKFTLNFSNKERILGAFKSILSRGTDEPLENWRTPFIHIGGAGLHFPRRDPYGKPVYPPNLMHPGRSAVAFRIPNSTTVPVEGTLEDILESIGYGGDWFDCHDVEEYLKTKGIYPDPQSSFVVVDSSLMGLPLPPRSDTMGTLTSGSSPQSNESTQPPHTHSSIELPNHPIAINQDASQLESIPEMDSSVDSWLGEQQMYFPNDFDKELQRPVMQSTAEQGRMLTIEIDRFLERLSDQGVCLGRAPGFRKEHVDRALALAMQEAF